MESNVFQKTADLPKESDYGFHIVSDGDERVVTIRYDQVRSAYMAEKDMPYSELHSLLHDVTDYFEGKPSRDYMSN